MKFLLSIICIGLLCLVCGNALTLEELDDGELLDRVRRVIGGQNAAQGQWPWMGSLRSATDQHVCGAILISEQAAITAAHCNDRTPVVTIVLGEINFNNPNPTRRTFEFIPHPEYDPDTCKNDIALLWFTQPVQFNPNIQPARIAESRDERNIYSDCTITGWGLVNQAPPQSPNTLQEADANFYSPLECANGIEDPLFCGETMLCGGNLNGGIATCLGDSGGPLQCLNSAGEYEIVGISSFFFHRATGLCGQPNNPHVFTRVSSYLEFITQEHGNNAPAFECPTFQLIDSGAQTFVVYTNPTCTLSSGGTGAVSCDPASPTPQVLPTVVTCTCADPAGNTYSISCRVGRDDPPPVIGSCPDPADIELVSIGGGLPVITYIPPTCVDDEQPVQVDCTPASSLTSVMSPRQIRCTCTDTAGSTVAITCPVETRLTVLPCPPTVIIVEGTATWTPPDCMISGTSVGTATCTPTSSDVRIMVNCVCSLGGQQDTCQFDLFPLINTPPTIEQCPTNLQLVSAAGQSFLTYTAATCTDLEDGAITVGQGLTCTPAQGTPLAFLPAEISCTCTDSGGLTDSCPVGNTQPTIGQCPTNVQLVSAGGQSFLTYTAATCTDPEDGAITVGQGLTCTPAQGTSLASLPADISCTCTDSGGLTDSCQGTDGNCLTNRCAPGLECREAPGQPAGYTCHVLTGQVCI